MSFLVDKKLRIMQRYPAISSSIGSDDHHVISEG